MAGAAEPLFAHKMPAIKVPCMQAVLSARAQVPASVPGISRILAFVRSGWLVETGPSIKPITTSDRPLVSCMSGVRPTRFNGLALLSACGRSGPACRMKSEWMTEGVVRTTFRYSFGRCLQPHYQAVRRSGRFEACEGFGQKVTGVLYTYDKCLSKQTTDVSKVIAKDNRSAQRYH